MNSSSSIGGYFPLELSKVSDDHTSSYIRLNTARNAIEYILEASKPSKVYVPLYTCDVILEPFNKLNIDFEFYHIDESLELITQPLLEDNEMLIYTNYFGIKDAYSSSLARLYGSQLIVDASQAFYYKQAFNEKVVYSPRKFFGVPDGGLLITDTKIDRTLDTDISFDRMSHLIKRLELPAEDGYEDFKRNDEKLKNQSIKTMSVLTNTLLSKINYDQVQQKRVNNFSVLHQSLAKDNKLAVAIVDGGVPMVYPYLVQDARGLRKKLLDNRIFIATYWPNVIEWADEGDMEYNLAQNTIPIPIDQRYEIDDMMRILEVIHASKN